MAENYFAPTQNALAGMTQNLIAADQLKKQNAMSLARQQAFAGGDPAQGMRQLASSGDIQGMNAMAALGGYEQKQQQMSKEQAIKRLQLLGPLAIHLKQMPQDQLAQKYPVIIQRLKQIMPDIQAPDVFNESAMLNIDSVAQIWQSMQTGKEGEYGGLTSAVDEQGNPVFIQPSKTGGVRQVEGFSPAPKPQSLGATYKLSEDESNAVSKAIAEGRLDPYKVNSRTAKQYAANEMRYPGTNWNQIGANTVLERNPTFAKQKINLKAVVKPIEELKTMAQKLGGTQYPAMNKLIVAVRKGMGDTDIVGFEATRNNVMQELANAMRGQGISEGSIQLEMSNWSTAYTAEQLGAAADETLKVIKAKQEALSTSPYQETGGQTTQVDNDPLGLR